MEIENIRRDGALLINEDSAELKTALMRRDRRNAELQWKRSIEERLATLEKVIQDAGIKN